MYTTKQRDKDGMDDLLGDRLSLEGLQGRQSVRATFQLPHRMIDLLGAVASQFGVKQKSLLDSLFEDRQILAELAENDVQEDLPEDDKRRKTFVISRKTLRTLEEMSRQNRVHRDRLLAISIARLFPVVVEEQAKHGKRVALLHELRSWHSKGQRILTQAKTDLGSEDAAFQVLAGLIEASTRQLAELSELIEKGKVMAELCLDGEDDPASAAGEERGRA